MVPDEIPDGYTVLRENFKTPKQHSLSLEQGITKLEIGSLYKRCTERIIHIYEEEQKIPKLINAVRDLIDTISSSQQQVSPTKETFNTEEAARKVGLFNRICKDFGSFRQNTAPQGRQETSNSGKRT